MKVREILAEAEGTVIKLRGFGASEKAKEFVAKVYAKYPGTFQNNHVMQFGEEEFAVFELVPSFNKKDAVEIKWIQAIPTGSGVGAKAMAELQKLAREDGIQLTLYPWDKGQVSQSKLMKFYKRQGFKTTAKGAKNMYWDPNEQ